MRRLAVDLGQARVEVSRPGGLRTTTTEVFRALDHLGYVHPLAGRPLPCEALPEREKVVERVIERVDRRFLGDGPELRREKVERLVRRYYLDVEPWPFAALTC